MRMSFIGHNPITNSHFDNYTFEYLHFENVPPTLEDLTLEGGCEEGPALFFDDDRFSVREETKRKEQHQLEKYKKKHPAPPPEDEDDKNAPAPATDDAGVLPVGFLREGLTSGRGVAAVTTNLNMMMPGVRAQAARDQSWDVYQSQYSSTSTGGAGVQPGYINGVGSEVSESERRMLLRNTQRIVTSTNHQDLGYTLEV
jgi:hypothetical protein